MLKFKLITIISLLTLVLIGCGKSVDSIAEEYEQLTRNHIKKYSISWVKEWYSLGLRNTPQGKDLLSSLDLVSIKDSTDWVKTPLEILKVKYPDKFSNPEFLAHFEILKSDIDDKIRREIIDKKFFDEEVQKNTNNSQSSDKQKSNTDNIQKDNIESNSTQTQSQPQNNNSLDFNEVINSNFMSTNLISVSFLNSLSLGNKRILRNSIYARHGYIFRDQNLTTYFSQYSWYNPNTKEVYSQFNEYEKSNVQLIKENE